MRRTMGVCLFLTAALLLFGCVPQSGTEETAYKIFCVSREGTSLEEQGYSPLAEGGEALVRELLNAMAGKITAEDCVTVFPEGLTAKISTLKDGRLTLDFSGEYHDMDAVQEVLFRAAVVQTLTQITDVQEVVFTIEGEALLNADREAVGPMQASTFINAEGDSIEAYQYETLTLYFADAGGDVLAKQMRNVHYASDASLEMLVLEELIAGPAGENLLAVLAPDTAVRSVQVEGGQCTVDLSDASNRPMTVSEVEIAPEAALYALVNSLCDSCPDISSVRILIEGSADALFWDSLDLSEPFTRNEGIIREQDSIREEETKQESEAAPAEEKVPSVGVDPNLTPDTEEESSVE